MICLKNIKIIKINNFYIFKGFELNISNLKSLIIDKNGNKYIFKIFRDMKINEIR